MRTKAVEFLQLDHSAEMNSSVNYYAGELISSKEAIKREKKYADDKDIGCYMYYLQHNNTKYW